MVILSLYVGILASLWVNHVKVLQELTIQSEIFAVSMPNQFAGKKIHFRGLGESQLSNSGKKLCITTRQRLYGLFGSKPVQCVSNRSIVFMKRTWIGFVAVL